MSISHPHSVAPVGSRRPARSPRGVALALLGLLLAAAPARGFDNETTRATLAGLEGVRVLVERFRDEAQGAGFSTESVRRRVEERLRAAGIEVLAEKKRIATLFVRVSPIHRRPGEMAGYSIEVLLLQPVRLDRDPERRSIAATWSVSSPGQGRPEYVLEHLDALLGQFIEAWRSANPKPRED